MQRRAYLAALAAIGVAGCSGTDEPTESPPTATGTATDTPTPTRTTRIDTKTSEPPETKMDTPEDTETPEQDTPDPYAGAQQYIEDARDQLREAYNTYVNQADSASSLVDVGVDVEFNSFDVTDELDRAENPIANAEASRTSDEQEATIRDLKTFRTALEVFAEVQADLGRGPDDMENLEEAFYNEAQFSETERVKTDLDQAAEAAEGELEGFDSATLDRDISASLSFLGDTELSNKHDQLQSDTDGLPRLGDLLILLNRAFESFRGGNRGPKTAAGEERYEDASALFETAKTELSQIGISGIRGEQLDAIREGLNPLIDGTADLASAAGAYAEDDVVLGDQFVSNAQAHFEADDDVASIPVVDDAPEV